MFKDINKSSGQASKLLLVLAIIVLVAVVITYLIIRMATPAPKPPNETGEVIPQPIYEQTLGNIRFIFGGSRDLGNVLAASDAKDSSYWQKDLATTERFIMVTIGAQNKGTINIEERSWDIENIVDSDGRNFVPLEGYSVDPWLPTSNFCGDLLKPEFDPLPCTKIYEVSKKSSGLKVRVLSGKNNESSNLSSDDVDSAMIDLIVK